MKTTPNVLEGKTVVIRVREEMIKKKEAQREQTLIGDIGSE